MEKRDTDTIAAQLIELGTKYEQTDAVEYQGDVYIRVARRVVAVYDPADDTIQVNEVRTTTDRRRVNQILEIVDLPRTLADVTPTSAAVPVIAPALTLAWSHGLIPNPPVFTVFTPRESFSCLTGASLFTAAARREHQEARDA